MAPDGSDQTYVSALAPGHPVWSPDGTQFIGERSDVPSQSTQIANFGYNGEIPQMLTSVGDNIEPDWQPVNPPPVIPGYPHPKGASPMRVPLVPAFDECTAPNTAHGPPLAFGSCGPPAQSSPYLTIGTPDSNGQPADSVAQATYKVLSGDVRLTAGVTTCAAGRPRSRHAPAESCPTTRVSSRRPARSGCGPHQRPLLDRSRNARPFPVPSQVAVRGDGVVERRHVLDRDDVQHHSPGRDRRGPEGELAAGPDSSSRRRGGWQRQLRRLRDVPGRRLFVP